MLDDLIINEADGVRAKLSKEVVVTVKFTEGDLCLLRDKWREQHNKARTKYKILPEFDDAQLIKYIVWEARGKETARVLKKFQKRDSSSS